MKRVEENYPRQGILQKAPTGKNRQKLRISKSRFGHWWIVEAWDGPNVSLVHLAQNGKQAIAAGIDYLEKQQNDVYSEIANHPSSVPVGEEVDGEAVYIGPVRS